MLSVTPCDAWHVKPRSVRDVSVMTDDIVRLVCLPIAVSRNNE